MTSPRIPLWVKIAYSLFMAALIPVYLKRYGATNFLYFCDVAAIMTLIGIWLESSLLCSTALIGIFLPQLLWQIDFVLELGTYFHLWDLHLTGMTSYMFRPPWFLRFLSFFHFWLPILLIYLVRCIGYDRRALATCIVGSWVLLSVCYAWMPEPSPTKDVVTGVVLRDSDMPVNINYVYGLTGDEQAQTGMEPDAYFALYMLVLWIGIYTPTHFLFRWLMPPPTAESAVTSPPHSDASAAVGRDGNSAPIETSHALRPGRKS